MAIQAAVKVANGIDVPDAYIRTKNVKTIKKDYEGTAGIYCTYEAEAFKSEADADAGARPLTVDHGLDFKITNLEANTGLSGAIVPDAFGILYADLKQQLVDRGWEASVVDIEDV